MIKLDLIVADNWDKLPSVWKVVKKVRPVDYKIDIENKGLLKIVQSYLNTDTLRLAQTGLYVTDNYVAATNGYKAIIIPHTNKIKTGVFNINPAMVKYNGKLYSEINQNFPNIAGILPSSTNYVYKIDVYKIKTYCEAVIKGKYCNAVTKQIVFPIKTDGGKTTEAIGVNGEFLIECLESFLLLGHEKIYVGLIQYNKTLVFSTSEAAANEPSKYIGKEIIVIVMPMLLGDYSGGKPPYLGARELDFGTEISAYYSFVDDKIHNNDGSIAKFDINLDTKELPYISENELKALEKVIPKKSRLPILDYVYVKDSVATTTDLDNMISIENVDVQDGLYELVSGAFKNSSDYKIDSYPKIRTEYLQDIHKIGECNAQELATYIEAASNFVGDDELRESMTGVFLHKSSNKVKIAATNAHILFTSVIKQAEIESKEKLSNIILRKPKVLASVLQLMGNETISIYFDSTYITFKSKKVTYSTHNIDSKYPNYEQVIEADRTDMKISFDAKTMINAINSLKGEEIKKMFILYLKPNGKADLKVGEVDKSNDTIKIIRDLAATIDYKKDSSSGIENENLALIMPMNTYLEDTIAFNPKYLKTILSVTKNDAELHYNSSKYLSAYYVTLDLEGKKSILVQAKESVKKAKEIIEDKKEPTDNQDLLDTIAGLEFLAEDGNQDAIDTIEGLKLLM
jgi:DNA polymerase III sliding clamp (beta) subunit (PCNA family)